MIRMWLPDRNDGMEILRQYQTMLFFVAIGEVDWSLALRHKTVASRNQDHGGVEPVDAPMPCINRWPDIGCACLKWAYLLMGLRCVNWVKKRYCQQYVDEIIWCLADDTCAAIKRCVEDTRSILEPAGAAQRSLLPKAYVERQRKSQAQNLQLPLPAVPTWTLIASALWQNKQVGCRSHFCCRDSWKQGSLRKFCECIGRNTISRV